MLLQWCAGHLVRMSPAPLPDLPGSLESPGSGREEDACFKATFQRHWWAGQTHSEEHGKQQSSNPYSLAGSALWTKTKSLSAQIASIFQKISLQQSFLRENNSLSG